MNTALAQSDFVEASGNPATRGRWEIPRLRDPRIPFAAVLTLYGVLGFSWLGFNRSPWQMLAIVASGMLLDMALSYLLRGRKIVPLSAYISCCSLALLLNYSHDSLVLFFPVLLTVGSKYLLTFQGRHVLNPSMFGVSMALLLSGEWITAAPAYQWAGGSVTMSLFMVMCALLLFVVKIGRNWLIGSFLLFYALQTALRAYILRHHIPAEMLFIGTVASPPFFLFTFYMLTDPATSPKTRKGQIWFAFAITMVDLWLHTKESVFTFFYAALILGLGKFAFLHARAMWRERGAYLRQRLRFSALRPLLVVGGLSLAVLGGYRAVVDLGADTRADFRMTRLAPAHTGIHTEMGSLFTEVDPRIAHVAKWILSVGDAAAVADVDGDGDLDLFLTNLLKRRQDRAALYLNQGDLRFERVAVPAIDERFARFREDGVGLPAGATFVDYDGDGDQDLALAVGFGQSRLYQNRLSEDGAFGFVDVSERAGLVANDVSLAISFFDFDRDAQLDMLVSNSIDPYLREYQPARLLNLFALPAAEYEGDRRMLRFMHNGWHDADNGGTSQFFRGLGDGRFAQLDVAQLGMPDSHWSLAVSTADFNLDGFTDLYLASDFGPDDVYLNRGGTGFERYAGTMFGDIGRDTYKGMNASVRDLDRNGHADVYVSNVHHSLQAEGSLLWFVRPSEDEFRPRFTDEATQRGALNQRRFGWGAGIADLDLDGWYDIVQANGMVDDRLDPRGYERKDYWYVNHKLMQSGPEIHTYADMWGDIRGRTVFPNEARRAYLNRAGRDGQRVFVDLASEIGIDDPDNSRGVILADFDNDGDQDLLVTNQHGPVSIYRNERIDAGAERPPDAHFVGLSLVGDGVRSHRSAIGTRVELRYLDAGEPVSQWHEVGTLTGFAAQGDPRLHFGLGDYHGPLRVIVHWYGATPEEFELAADRYHTLVQGQGTQPGPQPRTAVR
ncbi:FG-GAP-like repeat-containing protein [Haliangium ochraceum]|uniref:FG-GAP repeat protein n=1 Tax=Haliangium ochraceum (strain DSM 14365 / JCM 11303 / SMP-2) TaxID=502025 RepID=D0LSN5_HALO1|nr:FG-GAP-like repeat-containing protein [Haliangium ochraceum]ACY17257.1 FG-GAP repeat protein [Haliangium ochraceum DSM 14365]